MEEQRKSTSPPPEVIVDRRLSARFRLVASFVSTSSQLVLDSTVSDLVLWYRRNVPLTSLIFLILSTWLSALVFRGVHRLGPYPQSLNSPWGFAAKIVRGRQRPEEGANKSKVLHILNVFRWERFVRRWVWVANLENKRKKSPLVDWWYGTNQLRKLENRQTYINRVWNRCS